MDRPAKPLATAVLALLVGACGETPDPVAPVARGLFDRPIRSVVRASADAASVVELLRENESVWFVEQSFDPWRYHAQPSDDGDEAAVWRAVQSFPVHPGGVMATVEDVRRGAPRTAFEPMAARMALDELAPGQVLVDGRGVHVATRSKGEKPPRMRPRYPAPSDAILRRLMTPLPEIGGLLEPIEELLSGETRRAVRVECGTTIEWALDASDAGGELRFAHALQNVTAVRRGASVELVDGAQASARFRVSLRTADGAARELWADELDRTEAGEAHDVSLGPLPEVGPGAVLSFAVDPGTTPAGPPAHPVWLEPSITHARETERRPNVLLIVLDTLRADRLGCYGYDRPTSPYLDSFARESVLFEDVWSGAPWTLPSHASLLSSLHAIEHGVFDAGSRLAGEVETLAEVLWKAGYETAAFTEGGYARAELGLAQGFERFRVHAPEVEETFADAARWIGEQERPFFAFVQTYKVHAPYDPEAEFRARFVREAEGASDEELRVPAAPRPASPEPVDPALAARMSDLYDAEIAELDVALEQLLEGLRASGVLDETLVVITSDHGEEFGEHGQYGHGNSLYEEQLAVPLLVRGPRTYRGGRRVARPVLALDVAPTIARAAGAPVPAAWSGVPLDGSGRRRVATLWVPFRPEGSNAIAAAVRQGDLKFIGYPSALRPNDTNGDAMVFDLARDSGERDDLWPSSEEDHRAWLRLVDAMRARYPLSDRPERSTSNPEIRAQLATLGYAAAD
ncbi:MAG: sulfatase [Planctomycetota bacterium]